MKKFILAVLLLGSTSLFADWKADRVSWTITADTLVRIPNAGPGDELFKVQVTSCSAVPGHVFRIYDSSGVAASTIALNIQLSTANLGGQSTDCVRDYIFETRISSSITYTKQGTGEVFIQWKNAARDIQ